MEEENSTSNYYNDNLTTYNDVETEENSSEVKPLGLLSIFYTLATLGIIDNGITIYVIYRSTKLMKKVTNVLILNQSIADFITCIFLIVCNIQYKLDTSVFSLIVCNLIMTEYMMWTCLTASTFNLVLITLERYFLIVHPIFHRNRFSKRVAFIGIGCIWILCIFPGTWSFLVTTFENGECRPYSNWPSESSKIVVGMVVFFFLLLLPILSIILAYVNIFRIVRKRNKVRNLRIQDQSQNTSENNTGGTQMIPMSKQELDILKTTAFVSTCFIICNLPDLIKILIFSAGYDSANVGSKSFASEIPVILIYFNCIINPFIYAFNYEVFKREFNRYVCCNRIKQVGYTNDTVTQTSKTRQTHILAP